MQGVFANSDGGRCRDGKCLPTFLPGTHFIFTLPTFNVTHDLGVSLISQVVMGDEVVNGNTRDTPRWLWVIT